MDFQSLRKKVTTFLFTNTSSKQTVLKNTFWLMLAEGVSKGSIALITILIGRQFGTEIFGIYSYWGVILTFLIIFADLGLTTLLIRDYQHLEPEQRYHYLSQGLQTKGILSAIVIVLFLIILFLTTDEIFIRQIGLVLLAYQLGNSFLEYLRGTFRSLQTSEVEFTIKLIQGVGNLTLIPLIFLSESIFLVLLGQAIVTGLVSLYAWLIIKKKKVSQISTIGVSLGKRELIKQGWMFAMSGLFVSMYYYVDSLMIQWYRGYEEVGIYNAAYQIIVLLIAPINIITRALFPNLCKMYLENKKEFIKSISFYSRYIAIIGFIILMLLSMNSELLMQFIYGKEFIDSGKVLSVLILSVIILWSYPIYAQGLMAIGAERYYMKGAILGLIFNVILNIFLIKYGIIGAAYATLLTEILMGISIYFYFQKFVSTS